MATATEEELKGSADSSGTPPVADQQKDQKPDKAIIVRKEFLIAGTPRVVYDINVDGKGAKISGWRVHDGSSVTIASGGLSSDFFTQLGFNVGGTFYDIPDFQYGGGRRIEFKIPKDFREKFSDGTAIQLEFRNSNHSENNRYIQEPFHYFHPTAEEESAEQNKTPEEKEAERIAQGKADTHLMSDLVNDAIGGPAEAFMQGVRGNQPAASGKPGQQGGAPVSKASAPSGGGGGSSADDGSSSGQVASGEVLTSSQAAGIVGEFIDKNPEVISDVKIRTEVLSALSGGNAANLSVEARAALQGTVTQAIEAQGGQSSAQLQSALQVVTSQAGASSGQVEAEVQQTVESQTGAEVQGDLQSSTTQTQTSVEAQAGSNTSARVQASSEVQLSAQQSMEVVGEQLDKNPQLIPDVKVRTEVQEALSNGNISNLSPQGKAGLQGAVQTMGQAPAGQPPRVAAAAQNLASQIAQPPQTVSPQEVEAPAMPLPPQETNPAPGPALERPQEGFNRPRTGTPVQTENPPPVQPAGASSEQAPMQAPKPEPVAGESFADRSGSAEKLPIDGIKVPSQFQTILDNVRKNDTPGNSPLGGVLGEKNSKIASKGVQMAQGLLNIADKSEAAGTLGEFGKKTGVLDEDISEKTDNEIFPGKVKLQGSRTDINWVEKAQISEKVLKIAEEIAELTGRDDIADIARDLQGSMDPDELAKMGNDAGAIRAIAANQAGNYAAKKAGKLGGLSSGKSAAVGGAVAGVLEGEGATGIAKNALSWYILYIAFGALFTLAGTIPALVYLNIHHFLSKRGVSWFSKLSPKQRIILFFANFIAVVGTVLLFIIIVYAGCNYPIPDNWATGHATSIIGIAYPSVCKNLDSVFNSDLSKANNGTPTLNTPQPNPPAVPAAPASALQPRGTGP